MPKPMATLITLIADERGMETFRYKKIDDYRQVFSEAVEQVFGFRPGTPEALQFWQQHGETP